MALVARSDDGGIVTDFPWVENKDAATNRVDIFTFLAALGAAKTALLRTRGQSPEAAGVELSAIELTAIEARCNAATNGPWVAYLEGRDHEGGSDFVMRGPPDKRSGDLELSSNASQADIDFVAHARQDIPRLVAEVRRLRAQLGHETAASKRDLEPSG